jgi:type IV secretory pathway VirB9-like protein
MSGQNVQRELGQLSQVYATARAQMQNDTTRYGHNLNAAMQAQAATEGAKAKAAEMYLKYPIAEAQRELVSGYDKNGNRVSAEDLKLLAQRVQDAQTKWLPPFDAILAKQNASGQ